MLYRALLLALATVRGWNDCTFPDVDYFVLDEGVGYSYADANALCRYIEPVPRPASRAAAGHRRRAACRGLRMLSLGVTASVAPQANAAMNGNLYSGGITKGNFAFVGVTDGPDVNPVPSATLWGDTTSNIQAR